MTPVESNDVPLYMSWQLAHEPSRLMTEPIDLTRTTGSPVTGSRIGAPVAGSYVGQRMSAASGYCGSG
jgi:hypothetical protein